MGNNKHTGINKNAGNNKYTRNYKNAGNNKHTGNNEYTGNIVSAALRFDHRCVLMLMISPRCYCLLFNYSSSSILFNEYNETNWKGM